MVHHYEDREHCHRVAVVGRWEDTERCRTALPVVDSIRLVENCPVVEVLVGHCRKGEGEHPKKIHWTTCQKDEKKMPPKVLPAQGRGQFYLNSAIASDRHNYE